MKNKIILWALLFLFAAGCLLAFFPLPGVVPVLMYHFVASKQDARESKNFVSRESFAGQMAFLKHFGYHVISMEDYEDILMGKRKPRGKEIVLTFDDGNTTFKTEVFPVLEKYHFPATIFIVSESVKREINGSMSEKDIRELGATGLVTIGGHTKTHPDLSEMNQAQIIEELVDSKKDLEIMFGRPIKFLAYPSGKVDQRVVNVAKDAGYDMAFTTSAKKLKGLEESRFTITRPKISRTSDNPIVFWVKLSGLYQLFKSERHKIKTLFAGDDLPTRIDGHRAAETRPLEAK